MKDIYDAEFIGALFDKMSASYERVNYLTSFGFSARWRKQCVAQLVINDGAVVADLLTGMGECWPYILRPGLKVEKLIALDLSSEMIRRARSNSSHYTKVDIELKHENVFGNTIESDSVDHIISGFGLKTFNEAQLHDFAAELRRILKKGGTFSLVDVSVPVSKWLSVPYMFYLKFVIPFLGWLLLGNPETYRMLGVYTQKFSNARQVQQIFAQQGLEVEYVEYFFGCASGVKGKK